MLQSFIEKGRHVLRFIKSQIFLHKGRAALGAAAGGRMVHSHPLAVVVASAFGQPGAAGLIPPVAATSLDALGWACTSTVVSICGMVSVCGTRVAGESSKFDSVRIGWA